MVCFIYIGIKILFYILESSGSKYVEDIKIKNQNINLKNVSCAGL
jgi:hypothetical protein